MTCRNGHPINTENSYVNAKGKRMCRVCRRENQQQQYDRNYRASTPDRTFTRRTHEERERL